LKLFDASIDFVVVEKDEDNMRKAQSKGFPVLLGDASNDASLLAADITRAKGTVLCMKDDGANINIALAARELNSKQRIIARGSDPSIEYRLIRAGADTVVYLMKLGGEQIASIIAECYNITIDENQGGSANVLGYQLQVFKNMDIDKTVKELINKSQAVRPVAIRHTDGSMTHNPVPDTLVKHNEDKNNRIKESVIPLEWSDSLATGISIIDDEQLMIKNNYLDYENHHNLHQQLTRQVIELNRDKRYIFSDIFGIF